ncbi:MAG: hypothetical protein ACOVOQ_03050 [Flavobacterium sp.]
MEFTASYILLFSTGILLGIIVCIVIMVICKNRISKLEALLHQKTAELSSVKAAVFSSENIINTTEQNLEQLKFNYKKLQEDLDKEKDNHWQTKQAQIAIMNQLNRMKSQQ